MDETPPPSSDPPGSPPPSSPPASPWEPPSPGTPPGETPPPEPAVTPIPWEQPGLDFFTAFYETLRMLVRTPRKAFERVPVGPSLIRPLAFAVLVAWPGLMAGTLWDLALQRTTESYIPWLSESSRWKRDPAFEIGFALCAPIWLPIAIFIGSGVQHVFLMMVGGASRGYFATFRAVCYAQVATLLLLIPACGTILSSLWYLPLMVIGFSAVHRVTLGRAAFGVLLPLLLCCGCLTLLFAIFGAAWMGNLGM